MADNLTIDVTGGSTAVVRTQDNSGVHTQGFFICNADGTVKSILDVNVSAGDVDVTSHIKENLLIHTSGARTADPIPVENVNLYHDGVLIVIDVTAVTATPSVVPSLRVKDDLGSGKWITLDTYAAITGVGTTTYYVHPLAATATPAFTDSTQVCLGRVWSLLLDHADTDSITYSVGAVYL